MAREPKITDKAFIADKQFKEVKFEKIEHKEFKELKHEKIEKAEAKEHKDAKVEKIEKNEAKEHKDTKHEKLEKVEVKEHKDAKIEKIEHKEFTKFEHGEKPQGKEKDGKEIFEGPGGIDPGDPLTEGVRASGEGDAEHFIAAADRPDLSGGALTDEPDQAKGKPGGR